MKWRVEIYTGKRPFNKIYGGSHVAEAFGKWFDGPVDDDRWHLLWTYRSQAAALQSMSLPPQKGRLVNHCGYFRAAGQKCILAEHVSKVVNSMPKLNANISTLGFLHTFHVQDKVEFDKWMRMVKADPERYWIAKPCSGGASQGIQILKGTDVLTTRGREWLGQQTVLQELVERPYLGFGGQKFHLRLYILITRWWPSVGAFLFDEGFVFRSRHTYQHQNPSVKTDVFSRIADDVEGLLLSQLWHALDSESDRHHSKPPDSRSGMVRQRITNLFRLVLSTKLHESFGDPKYLDQRGFGCFDLLGADVMINEDLQPLLLEMNMSPNIWIDDHGDQVLPLLQSIKGPLVAQISHWSALKCSTESRLESEAVAIEDAALINFTRIL